MSTSKSDEMLCFSQYMVPETLYFTGSQETFTGKNLAYTNLAEAQGQRRHAFV